MRAAACPPERIRARDEIVVNTSLTVLLQQRLGLLLVFAEKGGLEGAGNVDGAHGWFPSSRNVGQRTMLSQMLGQAEDKRVAYRFNVQKPQNRGSRKRIIM